MGTGLLKYDLDLNLTKSISGCSFNGLTTTPCLTIVYGLYFDFNSSILYAAEYSYEGIHVFNSSLFRIDYINVTSYEPVSIALLNGDLLVGLSSNGIIRIRNKNVTQTVSNICPTGSWIDSIFIYKNQYILNNCNFDKRIQILHLNLTSTGRYLNTSGRPAGILIDKFNRLLVTTHSPSGLDVFI